LCQAEFASFLLGALPDNARARVVMLGNVDQLGESVGVNWIESRCSVARNLASGTVGGGGWRRDLAGTLPLSSHRGRGEKQRQQQDIQRWLVFDQSRILPVHFPATRRRTLTRNFKNDTFAPVEIKAEVRSQVYWTNVLIDQGPDPVDIIFTGRTGQI
jgi:hypothetical protein